MKMYNSIYEVAFYYLSFCRSFLGFDLFLFMRNGGWAGQGSAIFGAGARKCRSLDL